MLFLNILKQKNPANWGRRVSYLGSQLIRLSLIKKRKPAANLIGATSCLYVCF